MIDLPAHLRDAVARDRQTGEGRTSAWTVAGLLALLPAASILLVRVGINAPLGPRLPYSDLYGPVATAALVGPALAAVLIGIATDDDVLAVAMAIAGVFGLLAAVVRPAAVPATAAMVGAAGLIVVAHAERPFSPDEVAETVVGLAFLAGIAVSTVAALGVEPALLRPLGSNLALLAVAGSPVFVEWNRRSVLAGALAGAAIAGFGLAAPFVSGAASLIAGGIVGVSLPVMVLGVVGGVTLAATGIDRGQVEPALSGPLLLAAGVPATIPRALALVVGLALLTAVRR